MGYFTLLLPPHQEKKAIEVHINNLWVSVKSTMSSEKVMLDLSVDFIESGDSTNVPIGNCTVFLEKGGYEVSKKHEKRIREELLKCIEEFKSSDKKPISSRNEYLDLSIGVPHNLYPGIYKTYNSLRFNKVENEYEDISIESKFVNDDVTRTTIKNGKKKIKEYAYYNGEILYLNSYNLHRDASYYIAPLTQGRYLVYVDQYDSNVAQALFGLVGSLASTKNRASILDLKTGIIKPANEKYINEIFKDHLRLLAAFQSSPGRINDLVKVIQILNEEEAKSLN